MKYLADNQAIKKIDISPDRGLILDRNNRVLATNVINYDIGARYQDLVKPEESFRILNSVFSKSGDYYLKKLKKTDGFIYLERDVPSYIVDNLIERQNGLFNNKRIPKQLLGIKFDKVVKRDYPYNESACQLIGFLGKESFGLSGIEKKYNTILAGKAGYKEIQTDRYGKSLITSRGGNIPEQDGKNINLTIDIDYQIILEEELKRTVDRTGGHSGMGVIVNPNNGEILAMASYPYFNPNNYGNSDTQSQKNKVITDQFEPGSVFKIIPISAALENDIYTEESILNCENGEWTIFNRTLHDHSPSKWSSVEDILVHSSNIGAAKIAERLGNKLFFETIKKFGIGDPTGINIDGETRGTIRDVNNWERLSNSQIAMGQAVTTSLLQMVMAYSTIANGGFLLKPYIVDTIYSQHQKPELTSTPTVVRRVLSENTSRRMRMMLEKVVTKGTGTNAFIENYQIAGKTGTAQKVINGKYSDKEYMASFIAMFPAIKPVLVCGITVDSPKYGKHTGSQAAAPAVKEVFSRIINTTEFEHLYDWVENEKLIAEEEKNNKQTTIPVLSSVNSMDTQNKASVEKNKPNEYSVVMPNVTKKTLKFSKYMLSKLDMSYEIKGKGRYVKTQYPKAGVDMSPQTKCILYTE